MKTVFFDFDGVLAHTEKLCFEIHKIKNKDLTWENFQEYSSGNFHDGYDQAVKEGRHIPADDFYGQYEQGLSMMSIEEILHDAICVLAEKFRLAIISSTDTGYIRDFLAKENLTDKFNDILGADIHRNKTFKIRMLLEKYGISPEEAVFITDTLGDMKESRECGVPSIGVTWGLHDRSFLEKGDPAHIIENPQELVGAIASVLKI